jgi:hypothetical protein
MQDHFVDLTKQTQALMLRANSELLTDLLNDSQREDLRATIRIVIEFRDYLEVGSVELARSMYNDPVIATLDQYIDGYRDRLKLAGQNPFNEHDREYACETILSGVDCFVRLSPAARSLRGDTKSRIEWGAVSSRETFKSQFFALFDEFVAEREFEKKFRLLLDLFKLALVFVGFCY